MVSNKGISLTRKRELEEPDKVMTFLRNIFKLCIEYKTQASIAFTVFLALICIYIGYQYFSNVSEQKASALLGKNINKYQSLLNDKGAKTAYTEIEIDFKPLTDKYSGTIAGKMAGIYSANMHYRSGDYDKAIGMYENALKDFEKTQPFNQLILSGLGYAYEGKKDYKTAVKYFEMITTSPDDIMKEEAHFNLGRLYAELGDKEKSDKAYQTIISEYGTSMYIDLVKEKTT